MPGRYVKMIGASDLPLPNDPFIRIPSLRTLVRFPRDQFPRDMNRGDELVYYAVGGYKKLFAVARLLEDPRRDVPAGDPAIFKRWPHAAPVELGPHLEYVEYGPDLADVNPQLIREIRQGISHFPISPSDYATALRLIMKARLVGAKSQRSRLPSA
jgi:hypothetical protein